MGVALAVTQTLYDTRYFDVSLAGSAASAAACVPLILEVTRPRSVVDVGCGRGAWLAEFIRHGVDDALGMDGSYVRREELLIPPACFRPADLSVEVPIPRRFDLAVCLEVAEHLPPGCAGGLVDALTRLAPVVVFSAAVPGQGGDGHINERWPAFWAGLFEQRGYGWADPFRPQWWDHPRVDWWYAQNTLLFVSRNETACVPGVVLNTSGELPRAMAHPRLAMSMLERVDRLERRLRHAKPWTILTSRSR